MDILFNLEPRLENAKTILYDELEEMNEVIFIDNGMYEIGYDFNGEKKFPIRYKNTNVIGAYGLTFNKRSQFIYRTVTNCSGWFIRRRPWREIMGKHEQVTDEFKS